MAKQIFGGLGSGVVLPFHNEDPSKLLVVHVKVMSQDPEEKQRVWRAIYEATKDLRVADKGIRIVVTDENCTMNAEDAQILAAQILPYICETLGLRKPK